MIFEKFTSTYFLALSHAPPVLDIDTAIWTPETRAPARRPARVLVPNRMPTTTGESITRQPGGIISDRDACKLEDLLFDQYEAKYKRLKLYAQSL